MKPSLIVFAIAATSALDVMRIPLERIDNEPQDRVGEIGQETLFNHFNMAYFGKIKIGTQRPGTKAQIFKVLFGTGSTRLWVVSSDCEESTCAGKTRYDHSKSTTYVPDPEFTRFLLGYLMGAVEGYFSLDEVCLAKLCVTNQMIGEATGFHRVNMSEYQFDGLVGLGHNTPAPTIVNNMFEQGLIPENKFSFWLNRNPRKSKGGLLVLGGNDRSLYTGELSYFDVTSQYEWGITADLIKFGDLEVEVCGSCQEKCTVMVDTGTSFIGAPHEIGKAMVEKLKARVDPKTGAHVVECYKIDNFPDLLFVFNGKGFRLKPSDYVVKINKLKKCYAGISILPEGENNWIIGQSFIGKYFASFDYENHKVGFARAVRA